jgi:hypothetical protein
MAVAGYDNYGKAQRYGNIIKNDGPPPPPHPPRLSCPLSHVKHGKKKQRNPRCRCRDSSRGSSQLGLAYVLTVDMHIYQRVIQEMGDSYRLPWGMYYCCRVTDGGNHVGILVVVVILLFMLMLLVAGMIAWGILYHR